MDATTIAVDLAKHVFEVAIEDGRGQVSRRRLTRQQFARFLRDHTPALRRALLTLLEEIRDLERRAEAVERELTRRRAQDRNPIAAGEEFALLAKALAELHCRIPDRPHRAWSRWQPDRWRGECHLVDRQLAKRSHRIDLSFPSRTP